MRPRPEDRADGVSDSRHLWEQLLPQICEEEGALYLEHKNYYINNLAIVGSYLHYDYSAHDKNLMLTPEYYRQNKTIADAHFHRGLGKDTTFSKEVGDAFRERLTEAESRTDIEDILIVTHDPCLDCQMTRKPDRSWSILNAYFGNLSHEDFILSMSKVRTAVSGHTHSGRQAIITAKDGHEIYAVCLFR